MEREKTDKTEERKAKKKKKSVQTSALFPSQQHVYKCVVSGKLLGFIRLHEEGRTDCNLDPKGFELFVNLPSCFLA